MIPGQADEVWICAACGLDRTGLPKAAFRGENDSWVLFCDCITIEWSAEEVLHIAVVPVDANQN